MLVNKKTPKHYYRESPEACNLCSNKKHWGGEKKCQISRQGFYIWRYWNNQNALLMAKTGNQMNTVNMTFPTFTSGIIYQLLSLSILLFATYFETHTHTHTQERERKRERERERDFITYWYHMPLEAKFKNIYIFIIDTLQICQ